MIVFHNSKSYMGMFFIVCGYDVFTHHQPTNHNRHSLSGALCLLDDISCVEPTFCTYMSTNPFSGRIRHQVNAHDLSNKYFLMNVRPLMVQETKWWKLNRSASSNNCYKQASKQVISNEWMNVTKSNVRLSIRCIRIAFVWSVVPG